ncbi:MAG: hypothetical protein LBL49_04810 [Clostridiales Family XIII bacterium]|nr:hypothetical protein [Clostridiales Family XIII bacterium]
MNGQEKWEKLKKVSAILVLAAAVVGIIVFCIDYFFDGTLAGIGLQAEIGAP